jgi:hypothetical protein
MYSDRTVKNKILIKMRKVGLINKKSVMKPMRMSTVYGYDTVKSSIESQRHVFIMTKLSVKKGCKFDPNKESCVCGATLDEFLIKKC